MLQVQATLALRSPGASNRGESEAIAQAEALGVEVILTDDRAATEHITFLGKTAISIPKLLLMMSRSEPG